MATTAAADLQVGEIVRIDGQLCEVEVINFHPTTGYYIITTSNGLTSAYEWFYEFVSTGLKFK